MKVNRDVGTGASDLSIIRFVVREDFDQWLPLWEGYNKFYGRIGAAKLHTGITQTTWARFFDAYEPMRALVAEVDGKLIGLAHYLFHRNTAMIGPACYLQDLFTEEKSRGMGVGRALINAIYEQAELSGSTRVYWQTHETNLVAMKLYDKVAERSGFVVFRKQLVSRI